MGHRDLLVTQNLSDGEHHSCRPHPRGSVRRASGFVLTGNSEVTSEDVTHHQLQDRRPCVHNDASAGARSRVAGYRGKSGPPLPRTQFLEVRSANHKPEMPTPTYRLKPRLRPERSPAFLPQ